MRKLTNPAEDRSYPQEATNTIMKASIPAALLHAIVCLACFLLCCHGSELLTRNKISEELRYQQEERSMATSSSTRSSTKIRITAKTDDRL